MKSDRIIILSLLFLAVSATGLRPAAAEVNWETAGEEAVDYLSRFIRIDTTNPPGRTREAVEFLREILEREGIETRTFASDPENGIVNLMARIPGSGPGKPLMLVNHIDVVDVDRDRWDVEPFSGEIRDGYLWGRGALDMKGMGIVELMAVLLAGREGFPLKRDLVFLALADEETDGTLGAAWMFEHHPDLMQAAWSFNEGGFISRGLLTGDGRPVIAPAVGEKMALWLKLIAEGEGGHGSMPTPENPSAILNTALSRVLRHDSSGKTSRVFRELEQRLDGGLADNRFVNALKQNTVSLTSLQSGVGDPPKVNIIPTRAEATLDIRLLPGADPQAFLEELETVIDDSRIRVEIIHMPRSAPVSPIDSAAFQAIEKVSREYFPESPVVPLVLTGGTDSRFFRRHGIPSYGFQPFVVTASGMSRIHGPNERIEVDNFKRGVKIFYEIVRTLIKA